MRVVAAHKGTGRAPRKCGYFKHCHGGLADPEVAQHLVDWYTPSHVVHGILIYAIIWLLMRLRPSLELGLIVTALFASVWKVVETPLIVHSFGLSTRVADYTGDSVIGGARIVKRKTCNRQIRKGGPQGSHVTEVSFDVGFWINGSGDVVKADVVVNELGIDRRAGASVRWRFHGGGYDTFSEQLGRHPCPATR